jgi:hypothetical protein
VLATKGGVTRNQLKNGGGQHAEKQHDEDNADNSGENGSHKLYI